LPFRNGIERGERVGQAACAVESTSPEMLPSAVHGDHVGDRRRLVVGGDEQVERILRLAGAGALRLTDHGHRDRRVDGGVQDRAGTRRGRRVVDAADL
jgi:hypothetical protein